MCVCVCVCVSVCLSVTRRSCIETAAQIKLMFSIEISFDVDLSYTVFKEGIYKNNGASILFCFCNFVPNSGFNIWRR